MNISELINVLNGTLLNEGVDLSREVKGGCGADLMSDVLAYVQPGAVLLTGLCNPQVVRTSQMADVAAIVLVRGKTPPFETVELANSEEIPLISTQYGTYDCCARLSHAGLNSLEKPVGDNSCSCDE
jgi:predicted transcriptional regulator